MILSGIVPKNEDEIKREHFNIACDRRKGNFTILLTWVSTFFCTRIIYFKIQSYAYVNNFL